jgi:hypothetical protein
MLAIAIVLASVWVAVITITVSLCVAAGRSDRTQLGRRRLRLVKLELR